MDQPRKPGTPAYKPTPEEIAQATASIRAAWTRREEIKRRSDGRDKPQRWTPPLIGHPEDKHGEPLGG